MQNKRIFDVASTCALSCLLGGSLTMIVADAMLAPVSAARIFCACAVAAILAGLTVYSPKTLKFALAGVLALIAGGLLFGGLAGKTTTLLGGLYSFAASGEPFPVAALPYAMACVACATTLLLFWTNRMTGGAYPALTLALIALIAGWLINSSIDAVYTVLAIACLMALFARAADENQAYIRLLPMGVIAALIAVSLVPVGGSTWPPLADFAARLRQIFSDYTGFSDARQTYSLYTDGFQPLGETLGGPADPRDGEVMLVTSDAPLLLRGAIKRTYTNTAWTESAVNSRYLYIDPTNFAVRDDVFDTGMLSGLDYAPMRLVNARVAMLSDGISTLFMPHRLQSIDTAIDMAVYYNSSGEIFTTRGVVAGDTYSFSAIVQPDGTDGLADLLARAAQRGDDQYESIRQAYTMLPSGIDSRVYEMAKTVTASAATDYEKAVLLQNYLMTHYAYSLDMEYTPRGQDFVSYFLLKQKKGYCTYFASAFAVLCRAVRIPTRYIEGYMVAPGADGETVVTGRNAHAWVEVYFPGAGWISFNPTPGDEASGGGASANGGGASSDTQDALPSDGDDGEDMLPEDESPAATPTPEPTAAPENPDESDAQNDGGSQSEDNQNGDAPSPTPTPEPPAPEDAPEPTPPPDVPQNDGLLGRILRAILWVLVVLLALAGAAYGVYTRLLRSDPAVVAEKRKDAGDKLLVWYRAILTLLQAQGNTPNPEETPSQFAERLIAAKLAPESLRYVASQVELCRYAARAPEPAACKQAESAYARLAKQLAPRERIAWLWARLRAGACDIRQIP